MTFTTSTDTIARELIGRYYGDRVAERSQVPYIAHIDVGVDILQRVYPPASAADADFLQTVIDAFCLHPIFQMEDDATWHPLIEAHFERLDVRTVCWAREYKTTANAYLCKPHFRGPGDDITLSEYPAVNMMLVADKVQNRIDFEKHYLPNAGSPGFERAGDLQQYFANWLTKLGVSEAEYQMIAASL